MVSGPLAIISPSASTERALHEGGTQSGSRIWPSAFDEPRAIRPQARQNPASGEPGDPGEDGVSLPVFPWRKPVRGTGETLKQRVDWRRRTSRFRGRGDDGDAAFHKDGKPMTRPFLWLDIYSCTALLFGNCPCEIRAPAKSRKAPLGRRHRRRRLLWSGGTAAGRRRPEM